MHLFRESICFFKHFSDLCLKLRDSLHILGPWKIHNKFPDPDFQKSSWWIYLATWDVMTSSFFPVLFGIYSRVNLSKLFQNDKAEENPVVRGVIVSISLASSKKTDKTKTQQPKLHLFLPIEIISQVVKPKTSGRLFFFTWMIKERFPESQKIQGSIFNGKGWNISESYKVGPRIRL